MDIQEIIDIKYQEIEDLKQKLSEDHCMNPEQEDELEELIAKSIKFGELCAQRDAKASAPEGFVLVPKNKSEAFSKKLNDYLDDAWKDGNGFDDGFISVNEISHDKIWSLVIEAQEPSNV